MGKMKTFFLAFVALDAASTWQGRSGSLPPGVTMETMTKQMCHTTIYQILSKDNPTDYPKIQDGPGEFDSYSSSGGTCTLEYAGGMGSMQVQSCDCSDPKKYDFYDAELCKAMPALGPPGDKAFEKLTDLTCGSLFNFLSVGLMIFCTLLKL